MCTVSWVEDREGLHIFCNRDEMRKREPASSPATGEQEGVTFLAPRDGRAGGTWIAANERGLAVCLLNHYNPDADGAGPFPSRGQLVLSLMSCNTLDEVRARLNVAYVQDYRPCILLIFQRGVAVDRFIWDRVTLQHEVMSRMEPQTSSSFMTQPVITSRISYWRNLVRQNNGLVSRELLDAFHASHHPSKGAYSVCMHRPDAHTVSYTRVRLGHDEVQMSYQEKAPCKEQDAVDCQLPLVAFSGT